MRYISTRGKSPYVDFEEVVISGLARDGGLYVPETLPYFSYKELRSLSGLSYIDIAFFIIRNFIGKSISEENLKYIIKKSYANFSHKAIVPIKQLGKNNFLLELFHGPTLAFKDIALQLLGNLLDYFLKKRKEKAIIICATSGDTGSAAIEGCRYSENIDIFILHPYNMVSEVQRRQMTTVLADNVHNIAIEGNFDDAQAMVKACFINQSFLNGTRLIAVNSINWVRIMAQTVYYITSAINLGAPDREISFTVPSANFGNILAGYFARRMGLPIRQLVIATNANDIIHRIISNNDFSKRPLINTIAPSMDIVISSNFERLLYYLYSKNSYVINNLYNKYNKANILLSIKPLEKLRSLFSSGSVNDETILSFIIDTFKCTGEILDPHTTIAYYVSKLCNKYTKLPMVILGTAHPAKFFESIKKTGINENKVPSAINNLLIKKEYFKKMPANIKVLQNYIINKKY
ncbi:Threonine synthase [Candidatus Johnevansia muelleri]|uniref:Threonine synthase n=1 Tax=Candidatus Johnevansia muelleri TaxID=1495769 RepID=A0A078KDM2_9GAMM|nr:Threonine synthase [Candidatus Evansia muelleri]